MRSVFSVFIQIIPHITKCDILESYPSVRPNIVAIVATHHGWLYSNFVINVVLQAILVAVLNQLHVL